MKFYYVLIFICLLYGCTSKYPLKINIDDYKRGLEITNSIISSDIILKNDICIELDSSIPVVQQLKRQIDGEVFYTFENRALLNNYNNAKCHAKNTIKVTNITSKYSWDGMFRLNTYKSEISLESTYQCNNEIMEFSSIMERKLTKHGKLVTLGIISEEKEQALIAATIVLAFDTAISDIYNQIQSQCNQWGI